MKEEIKTVEQRSDGGVCGELGGRGEGEGGHGVVRYFEFRFLAKFQIPTCPVTKMEDDKHHFC